MTTSPTLGLAGFAASLTLADLPRDAKVAARWALLDAMACAVGGSSEPVSVATRSFVDADHGPGPATLWGTARTAPPSGAALANGAAAHALDFDDVCWAMNGHPSVVLAPAVLAAAEAHGASGADVLRAYCVGFEVAGRLGEAMGHSHYAAGFHPTATLGVMGATAGVATMLGLDVSGIARALGIAVSTAAGTRLNFGTDTKALHAGLAARGALTAAELAGRGVSARTDALEGPMGFVALYQGQGTAVRTDTDRFVLLEPGIEHKPYPCCRFTHRVIEAVTRVRDRHPGRRPTRITCHVDPFSRQILIYDRATTGLEAKFSMQTAAALAWLDGPPRIATFEDERVRRSDVGALASRVDLFDGSTDEESITVAFEDRETDSEAVRLPLGHPQRPMPALQHIAKIHDCADGVLGASRVDALIRAVEDLERLPQATELTALLRPAS